MAVSNKTREILWRRSGYRCALCQCELMMHESSSTTDGMVGEECAIATPEPDAPHSASPLTSEEQGDYPNLILLCQTHHQLVKSQPQTYSASCLKEIKAQHEAWVRETLKIELQAANREPFMLYRIETGKYLISLLYDSHASVFNHDLLESGYEAELVNGFFQAVQDHITLWDNFTAAEKVLTEVDLDKAIWQVESSGFLVYGCQRQEASRVNNSVMENWCTAYLLVMRQSNPLTVRQSTAVEKRMGVTSPADSQFSSFILVQQSR